MPDWSDVLVGVMKMVGVLPALLGIALGVAVGLLAFGWLMRRDPIIHTQAETIRQTSEVVLKHTEAVEKYNQQVLDLQNSLDATKDEHAQTLKRQDRAHQAAIDHLTDELRRVKQAAQREQDDRSRCESELRGQIEQLSRDLGASNDRVSVLTGLLDEAHHTIRDLKAEADRLAQQVQTLQGDNQTLRVEAERLSEKVRVLEGERDTLQDERTGLLAKVEQLTTDLRERKTQMTTMQATLDALERRDGYATETSEAGEEPATRSLSDPAAEAADLPSQEGEPTL